MPFFFTFQVHSFSVGIAENIGNVLDITQSLVLLRPSTWKAPFLPNWNIVKCDKVENDGNIFHARFEANDTEIMTYIAQAIMNLFEKLWKKNEKSNNMWLIIGNRPRSSMPNLCKSSKSGFCRLGNFSIGSSFYA